MSYRKFPISLLAFFLFQTAISVFAGVRYEAKDPAFSRKRGSEESRILSSVVVDQQLYGSIQGDFLIESPFHYFENIRFVPDPKSSPQNRWRYAQARALEMAGNLLYPIIDSPELRKVLCRVGKADVYLFHFTTGRALKFVGQVTENGNRINKFEHVNGQYSIIGGVRCFSH